MLSKAFDKSNRTNAVKRTNAVDSPRGPVRLFRFFINKCRHDINKLNFNLNTKFSNLSSEERAALENLSKRKDVIVKAADKGGALFGGPTSTKKKLCGNFLAPAVEI